MTLRETMIAESLGATRRLIELYVADAKACQAVLAETAAKHDHPSCPIGWHDGVNDIDGCYPIGENPLDDLRWLYPQELAHAVIWLAAENQRLREERDGNAHN